MPNSRFKNQHSTTEDEESWKKIIEFYRREFLCDIRLKGEWESKLAHKLVLDSLCPTGPWTKMRTEIKSSDVVELDVSVLFKQPGILTTVIDYIYLGMIKLNNCNIFSIVEVANELKLTELLSHSSQFLLENLHVENVLPIFNVAYEMNLHDLMNVCLVFSREVFDNLLECNNIKVLSKNFMKMFMSQSLITSSVEPSKRAFFLLRWLLGNIKNIFLVDFLKSVDINQFQFQEGCCMMNQITTVTDSVKAQLRAVEKLYFKPTPAPVSPTVKEYLAMGGRYILVRDCKAATVYDTVSGKWLTMPHAAYKHIISLSKKTLTCSDERLHSRTLDVIDINNAQKVKTVFIGNFSRYLGPIFFKKDLYILVENRRRGAYEFILYKTCDDNDEQAFIRCFQYTTHIHTRRIIKDFCYYNDDDCTILVLITCSDGETPSMIEDYDFFDVFRLNWQPYSICTLIRKCYHYSCNSLSNKNFTYYQRKFYVFGNEIANQCFDAIQFNVALSIDVGIYELFGDIKFIQKHLVFPKLGLHYLPLRPKSSICNLINSSGVNENILPCYYIQLEPIGGKLFLAAHRAPAIVQCFMIDILTQTWKITAPIPLNGIFELEVSTFYCEESIDKVLPERKKVFDSIDVPIFNDWHLQTLYAL